jgi:hypothetical protein
MIIDSPNTLICTLYIKYRLLICFVFHSAEDDE